MIRSYIAKLTFTLLISFCLPIVTTPTESPAEEKPPIISGRVVNQIGEPITDSTVVLIYVKLRRYGGLDPLYDKTLYPFLRQDPPGFREHIKKQLPTEQELREHPPYIKSVKDTDGNFIITGIVPGTVQLRVVPDNMLEKDTPPVQQVPLFQPQSQEINAIRFGKALFYPHPFLPSHYTGEVTFAIKPGANIQDVEIIMKSGDIIQQKIQGKMVFKNGEPLVNKAVNVNVNQLDMDGTNGSYNLSTLQTDANGNFELFVNNHGIIALSLKYLGLKSYSDLFIVRDRRPYEGLVLTLNGNPSDLTDTGNVQRKSGREVSYASIMNFPNVWVVNPENGHSYKAIRFDGTRKDAQAKAEAEDAHLVTITSEDEQVWLDVVYEGMWYWIGLKYEDKRSRWEWDTGEQLSYINWKMDNISTLDFTGHRDIQGKAKDYVIMTTKGQWQRVPSEGLLGVRTQKAVIEKDGLHTNAPKPVK